jgi:hypothetical protein
LPVPVDDVLLDFELPTTAWLSAALRRADILPTGQVIDINAEPIGAFNSRTSRLIARYSPDAPPSAPTRFVLKRNVDAEWGIEAGREEVGFYRLVSSLSDHPEVTVPCYVAAFDPVTGRSLLLLRDLSETHAPPITRDQQLSISEGVPPARQIDLVVDTLARFHAYWWEQPNPQPWSPSIGYWSRDEVRFSLYFQRRRQAWEDLLTREGDWLPLDVVNLYERVFAGLRRHWESYLRPRFASRSGVTLIHGDCYFCNFLAPRDPSARQAYLLDWQSPTFDLGAYDLANLLAAFWSAEQRAEGDREITALRRYYAMLRACGVSAYTWNDLLADYRSALIFWLLMPVQDRFGGASRVYWWPKLQCLVAAFRDWDCDRLLST